MTSPILQRDRRRNSLICKTLAGVSCALLVSVTSAWAGDGLDDQYEVFSPENGYLPAVAADAGGAGTDPATKGCFVEAIWLGTDDQ